MINYARFCMIHVRYAQRLIGPPFASPSSAFSLLVITEKVRVGVIFTLI